MFTLDELRAILYAHYTPEEICEMLNISSYELVNCFDETVELLQDKITKRIKEDLGYDEDTEDTED